MAGGRPGGDIGREGYDRGVAAPEGADHELVRIRLVVAYLGTGLRGFAAQPGLDTVAGRLEAAIGRYARRSVRVVGAGRTDAGVHAFGQVVHVDVPEAAADPEALARSCNRQLAPAIVIREATAVGASFDARRSAVARRYRYLLATGQHPNPLLAAYSWWVGPLELAAMRLALDAIVGEHDFSSFCRRPPGGDGPLVRRVLQARVAPVAAAPPVDDLDGLVAFEIEANAFCHQMVRALTALLVHVGKGRVPASAMGSVLDARSRAGLPTLAPPAGLCLLAVRYQ